uniref:Ig-like domain-containing protein n=1 Tax=Anser cygnoides TaxID=8845 RepID=A0A8B9IN22_ANSCY
VTATVGQDVVLPCHLSPQRDAHTLEVRWIRHSLSETVHHYHNGEDLYGELMGAYVGRTEITGLRPSDDGQYICTVEDSYNEAIVELEVSATGVDSHLSLGGYEAGGVRVLCRSAGWYPLLQLLWRDARGQHLPSVSQTYSQDQEGLFEIEGSVIVTGSVEGPLSCVVRSSRLQQEWESSLHIAAPFFHNAQPWMVALALVLVQEVPHLLPCGAAPGPELGKACPGLSSAPDGLAPSVPAVKVTLDADTAHPQLVLSQDNSSVRWETQKQQVSDTSERFDTCCCVLGREEFREGRHCWLVEVERKRGKYLWWAVGVARASVKRKKWIDVSPEEGIWAVQYNEGQLMALTSPRTPFVPVPCPHKDLGLSRLSSLSHSDGLLLFSRHSCITSPWSCSSSTGGRGPTAPGPGAALCSSLLLEEGWDAASRGQAPCRPWALPCTGLLCWGTSPAGTRRSHPASESPRAAQGLQQLSTLLSPLLALLADPSARDVFTVCCRPLQATFAS